MVATGVIAAGLLLIVVANISGPGDATGQPDEDLEPITALINPPPVPPEMLDGDGAVTGIDQNVQPMLERGAWIQVADADGALAQQYRCQSLSPNPPGRPAGWFEMERPEAEIFLADARVLKLSGDSGLAFSPHRRLEEGTLSGNVRIRVVELSQTGREHTLLDVTTSEASFDSVSGQMHCPEDVLIRGERIDLDGRAMRLLFDDRQNVMRLRLESVDEIVLHDQRQPAPAVTQSMQPRATVPSAGRPAPPPATGTPSVPAVDPATFYELVLHDAVQVDQVNATGTIERTVGADELRMIFTFESDGFSDSLTSAVPAVQGRMPLGEWRQRLALAALATTDQPTEERLVIRCTGPLTVEPLSRPGRVLDDPRDTRLTMVGSPVRIDDRSEQTTIECATVIYDATTAPASKRVRLLGSETAPFQLRNADLLTTGSGFDLNLTNAAGAFTGAGTATWRDPAREQAPLHITWSDGVDLVFAPDPDGGLQLGPVRETTFIGDVHVDHPDFTLDAARVQAELADHDGEARFRTLTAAGNARAIGLLDGEALHANEIRLEFADDASGEAVPRRLLATGNVEAARAHQMLWADRLDVEFEPSSPDGSEGMRVDATSMRADGTVQLLLEDGTRSFADSLIVDAHGRTALLRGDTLRIVQDRVIIDQATEVHLDEVSGEFRVTGRGRLRAFDQPVLDAIRPERVGFLQLDQREGLLEELRILWNREAEFLADANRTGGRATFLGDVAIRGRDLTLDHAQTLIAQFIERDGDTMVDRIDASGTEETPLAVVIRSAADRSDNPARQRLWASTLHVELDRDPTASADEDAILVESFTAETDVRIALDDGTIVMADRVIGFPDEGIADLHGQPVTIVSRDSMLLGEPSVRLVDDGSSVELMGGGELRVFEAPIPIAPRQRFDPHADFGPTTLVAQWTDSATYAPADELGTSVIDLRGTVHVDARPTALERVQIDADALSLELVDDETGDRPMNDARALSGLLASGSATLEHVAWQRLEDVEQQDRARVFSIAGEHIWFDNPSGVARVTGTGQLLVHDPWDAAMDEATTAFNSRGTTLFRWQDGLEMSPLADARSSIVIRGAVQMLHKSTDGETASVTADQLNAVTRQARGLDERAALDLGGESDLDSVGASGNVFVRTSTRDITCDRFEYQMDRLAELIGSPGGVVVVRTRGEADTIVANRVRWDLVEDRMTVVGAAGTAGSP